MVFFDPDVGELRREKGRRKAAPRLKICKNQWTELVHLELLVHFLLHYRELQLGFGQRLDDETLGVFRSKITGSGHLANEEILGALEHFLFAEGEGLAAAEGDEAFENNSHFQERTRAHALGVLLETMFPVMMRIELASLEEAEHLDGIVGANDRTKTNSRSVGGRNHNAQAAGDDTNHEITFGTTVEYAVTYLFYNPYAMVRINDFVADLVFHRCGGPQEDKRSVDKCAARVKIYPVK